MFNLWIKPDEENWHCVIANATYDACKQYAHANFIGQYFKILGVGVAP